MPSYSFKAGEMIALEDTFFLIEHVIGEMVHVVGAKDAHRTTYSAATLLEHFAQGRLKFITRGELESGVSGTSTEVTLERSLADFPLALQQSALRKWRYLNAICPDGRLGVSRPVLAQMLRSVWTGLGAQSGGAMPPSIQSFYRWRSKWVWARFDVRSLIDKHELRGRRPTSLPEALSELIEEGIEKIYLTPQRESLRETRDWIQLRIEQENRRRAPTQALPDVTHRMLRHALSRIDRYAILKTRYGQRYAQDAVRVYGKGPACTYPLERVEVDHTPLDVLVVDAETGLLLGRPWITVMIDGYSRMIVGIHISFRNPSVRSVLRCLKHAILPKVDVKERFPKVNGEWKAYGLIHQLVCDNGLEFHAHDLEAACAELGAHVVYCPTRSPQMKGRVERFLKTLNYGFVHLQPGTTFATYDKRHVYDSGATAALTLESLQEIVHRWIVDVYSVTFHRAIQSTPSHRWDEGIQKFPPRLPKSADVVNAYLGNCSRRHLTKNGIEVHSLQYNSAALQELRRRCGNIEVSVRTDPDDLGAIFVFDDQSKRYLEARSTMPGYADGVSVEQHRWIRSKARRDYAASPMRHALLAAKADLRADTEKAMDAGRALRGKDRRKTLPKHERELMVQQAEARQQNLPLELESDEPSALDEPTEDLAHDHEVPLFPVRRGTNGVPPARGPASTISSEARHPTGGTCHE